MKALPHRTFLLRFPLEVVGHIFLQKQACHGVLLAEGALVELLPSVHVPVLPERAVFAEGLAALAALIGLLSSVYTPMCPQ